MTREQRNALGESSSGRIYLHFLATCRFGNVRYHAAGIKREILPAFRIMCQFIGVLIAFLLTFYGLLALSFIPK